MGLLGHEDASVYVSVLHCVCLCQCVFNLILLCVCVCVRWRDRECFLVNICLHVFLLLAPHTEGVLNQNVPSHTSLSLSLPLPTSVNLLFALPVSPSHAPFLTITIVMSDSFRPICLTKEGKNPFGCPAAGLMTYSGARPERQTVETFT